MRDWRDRADNGPLPWRTRAEYIVYAVLIGAGFIAALLGFVG